MVLSAAYREQVTETLLVIYHDALMDLPEELVLKAMAESIKVCKFFPRVAEIRELVTAAQQRVKDTERARRIQEDLDRRRLEVEDWRRERATKGALPAPTPIGTILKKVLEERTPEEIEARKQELHEQAERVKDDEKKDDKAESSE